MGNGLKGTLLDIDGTLVDSNNAHALAWEDVLREFGHNVPLGAIRRLIGMGGGTSSYPSGLRRRPGWTPGRRLIFHALSLVPLDGAAGAAASL